ncbi:MAG: phytanoyl-CoA dioxygenase family protein [Actinomycetota bacterium]
MTTPTITFSPGDPAAAEHFRAHGWVVVDSLDAAGAEQLRTWVDDIAAWPDDAGEWLHYRELTDHGPKLCRTENFVPFHAGMRALLTSGEFVATASLLLDEPAVLYKEKINYKLAGGAGYAAHQDAPAYPFIDVHVSCMVAIDDSLVDNGCLEVVDACHHALIAGDERGCIPAAVEATMMWQPVEVRAGQTLWFHSLTPHRSGPNTSALDRRAIYPTYNAASAGDLRDEYYRTKLAALAERAPGDTVTVSLIGDFQGRPVP